MPAGGIWKAQNKRRPGAYINFLSVPRPVGVLGTRGIVAVGLSMTWGAEGEIIKLTGAELLDGTSLPKIGCTALDVEESLPYRLALAGSYTALLFRLNSGATKASASVTSINANLTAVAKYSGTTGNDLSIAVTKDIPETGTHKVEVLHKSIIQEEFFIKNASDFADIESDWITFSISEPSSETITGTAGIDFTGGTNGSFNSTNVTNFLGALEHETFQTIATDSSDSTTANALVSQIEIWREQRGKKVQAVVPLSPDMDTEGVISVSQGFKTPTDEVGADLFSIYVASITAGADVNESLTAKVVPNATEIISPYLEDEIGDKLAGGNFILSYRQDGAVVIEQDINSLHEFTVDKNYAFSKNRVIRCLDGIANQTALIFNKNYAGKVDNNATGRTMFKAELVAMIDQLVALGAVTNFDGASDIVVLPGQSIDSVVVDLTIQPVDSMEKLYMTVNVNA